MEPESCQEDVEVPFGMKQTPSHADSSVKLHFLKHIFLMHFLANPIVLITSLQHYP